MFSRTLPGRRADSHVPLSIALAVSLLLHVAIFSSDRLLALLWRQPPPGDALPKVSVTIRRLTPEPPNPAPPSPVAASRPRSEAPQPRPAPAPDSDAAYPAAPESGNPPAAAEPPAGQSPPETADVAPQTLLGTRAPDYPKEVLRLGLQGCVLYALDVDRSGGVERVEIMQSDHPGLFDAAIVAAQQSGRYLPAFKGGRPVKSRIFGVASFEIEGNPPLNCALRFVDQVGGRALVLRE